jgi:hypothetical protein
LVVKKDSRHNSEPGVKLQMLSKAYEMSIDIKKDIIQKPNISKEVKNSITPKELLTGHNDFNSNRKKMKDSI